MGRMRNWRIAGLVAIALASACASLWRYTALRSRTGESERTVSLELTDGSRINALVGRFNPAHVITPRAAGYTFDLSSPTGAIDALRSGSTMSATDYLCLLDEGAQAYLRLVDRESGGVLLSNQPAADPPPTPGVITHWVQIVQSNKTYRIMALTEHVDGKDYPGAMMVLVRQQDGHWLQTRDLENSGILRAAGMPAGKLFTQ